MNAAVASAMVSYPNSGSLIQNFVLHARVFHNSDLALNLPQVMMANAGEFWVADPYTADQQVCISLMCTEC
jgi:hypothetical protein